MYMVALFFLNVVTDHLADHHLSAEEREVYDRLFKDRFDTSVTMFMCVTGGTDWEETFSALRDIHIVYGIMFLQFVLLFLFVVFNVLTGIIVQDVATAAKYDEEAMTAEFKKQRKLELQEVERLYHRMAPNGVMSWEEFREHLQDETVRAYLDAIQLDIKDERMFFRTLAAMSESQQVCMPQFIEGCDRMKGTAMSIDVQSLLYISRWMYKIVKDLQVGQARLEQIVLRAAPSTKQSHNHRVDEEVCKM